MVTDNHKPTSRLFQSITEEEYQGALNELREHRKEWPGYYDHDLLMALFIHALRMVGEKGRKP